jgi:hypothetical protein
MEVNAMGRLATLALAALTAATVGATTPALAQGRGEAGSTLHRDRPRVEVVVDVAVTRDGARDMLDRVIDHGFRDFRIERDPRDRLEVERPFDRAILALREIRMLHRDGLRAHFELKA